MPPPPWKWQPEQLDLSKSCCPWLMAQAFPSYGLLSAVVAPSCFGPGCSPLTRTGIARMASCADGWMVRSSRWQAAARSASRTSRLDTRHSVLVEDAIDVGAAPLEGAIELVAQRVVAAPHAHRDVEDEGEEGEVDLRRDRRELERDALLPREPAGLRAPDDGDVDVTARDGVDDRARVVDHVADDVGDRAAVRQRMRRRRVDVVVPDHLHADAPRAQPRIVERDDAEVPVTTRDEDVGGAVIRLRLRRELVIGGNAEDAVADACLQRVAHEAAPLREPEVVDVSMKITPDERRNLVFEALLLLVRIREIVRVSANTQDAALSSRLLALGRVGARAAKEDAKS